MPLPSFTVTCTHVELIAHNVYDIRFTKADGFTYRAGQYVMFDIPHPDNPQDIQARAYSIASAPHEPQIRFVIRLLPGGRMSRFIVEKLKVGMDLTMKGPLGIFTFKPEEQTPVLLIGTSTGIAPFRAMLADAIERRDTRPVDLVFGARHEEDLFWVQELQALVAQHPNARLHVALSQPQDAWTGLKGRVQAVIPQLIPNLAERRVYLCGNPAMVKEVKALCVGDWGLAKDKVHAEEYV